MDCLGEVAVTWLTKLFNMIPEGRCTTDAKFALRIAVHGRPERVALCFYKVPGDEPCYCMRKSGVTEKYFSVVKDMYEESITSVRRVAGTTEGFRVKVGLHQGSPLSPFLFALVTGRTA
ncbi:uncharacterized protein LOC119598731 [Penaeus monodon]|uniref:uncharacterized protein LOC119598731 n=1 Tax=Penaeus monodon TaxID=6687 RepID=UPI0018A71C57|nr:uncharacterized protein LOC119598731 [Penaeus monodon]